MRALILAAAFGFAATAAAADPALGPADGIDAVLAAQKDKRITIRLRSGQELTGVVKQTTPRLVQLSVLGGREYFDALIPIESVEAVLLRRKE